MKILPSAAPENLGSLGIKARTPARMLALRMLGAMLPKTYYTRGVTQCQGENRCAQDVFSMCSRPLFEMSHGLVDLGVDSLA